MFLSSFENNMVSAFDDVGHHGPTLTSQQKEDIKQFDENSLYGDFVAAMKEDFLPSFKSKDEGPPIMRTRI
jgi:hypothetical protein